VFSVSSVVQSLRFILVLPILTRCAKEPMLTVCATAKSRSIVPALNEAANLPLLRPRNDAALRGRDYEVIIVDDNSQDGTPDVCESLSPLLPPPPAGSAMAQEWAQRRGAAWHVERIRANLLVMDADLQHPPEKIPRSSNHWRKGKQISSSVRATHRVAAPKRDGPLPAAQLARRHLARPALRGEHARPDGRLLRLDPADPLPRRSAHAAGVQDRPGN